NVEKLENFSPILYLRRGLAIDSAGPGRFPGGSAAGASFMVHDAPFLGAVLEAHGVEVPNSLGVAGGYPGSCNHRAVARQTDAAKRFAAGHPVTGVDDVDGHVEVFGAKPGRLVFAPGDVFDWRWQGGGGYGDPLDAPPAVVAADVGDGAVSAGMADRIYGVVLSPDGTVDVSATERRRDEIRAQRRARPAPAAS